MPGTGKVSFPYYFKPALPTAFPKQDIEHSAEMFLLCSQHHKGLSGASLVAQMVKNLPTNAEDTSSIPGLGRSRGKGNGYSLQYSCLETPMDRGAWQATMHGVARVRHNLETKIGRAHV